MKIICNKKDCWHYESCIKDHTSRQMNDCMSHSYSLYEIEVAEEEKIPYDRICPMCECCDMEVVDYRKCREKKGYGSVEDQLVEKLAEFAHKQWSGWMEYMFSKCEKDIREDYQSCTDYDTEDLIIPKWAIVRWQRQMLTEYKNLSEEEKESDRKEAREMLKVIKGE